MKLINCVFCLLFVVSSTIVYSRPPSGVESRQSSTMILDDENWVNANSILMFSSNVGWFAYDQGIVFDKYDGFYWPFTTIDDIVNGINSSTMVYAAGIWVGGVDSTTGDTLVSAASYGTDFWPGPMSGGSYIPGAETDPSYRVFKLYSDSLQSNPNTDYLEWPVNQGAPLDGTGKPKLIGSQTLWTVFNDAKYDSRQSFLGSDSGLSIEIQVTTWAMDTTGPEGMSVYSKYKLINKGPKLLKNFFISLWLDPDLGDLDDDLIGCDTLNDIFYCYNSGSDVVYGSSPPAFGAKLIQGPIVPSAGDTAYVDETAVPNYKNLGMYSFGRFTIGTDPLDYIWSYQYMLGLDAPNGGTPYPNGTRYAVPGDPVAGTGDLDFGPSDRRMMASFGPIRFLPNDTQQIIVKLGVGQGTSPINSITELKTVLNYTPPPSSCCIGIRGDLDGNGTNNTILDLNYLVNDIFRGGPASPCSIEADLNSDGSPSTILDLNFLVNDIFRGGPSPGPCESK